MTRKQSRTTQRILERALFGPGPKGYRMVQVPKPAAHVTLDPRLFDRVGDCPFCGNRCHPVDDWTCPFCGHTYPGGEDTCAASQEKKP